MKENFLIKIPALQPEKFVLIKLKLFNLSNWKTPPFAFYCYLRLKINFYILILLHDEQLIKLEFVTKNPLTLKLMCLS